MGRGKGFEKGGGKAKGKREKKNGAGDGQEWCIRGPVGGQTDLSMKSVYFFEGGEKVQERRKPRAEFKPDEVIKLFGRSEVRG